MNEKKPKSTFAKITQVGDLDHAYSHCWLDFLSSIHKYYGLILLKNALFQNDGFHLLEKGTFFTARVTQGVPTLL